MLMLMINQNIFVTGAMVHAVDTHHRVVIVAYTRIQTMSGYLSRFAKQTSMCTPTRTVMVTVSVYVGYLYT